MPNQHTVCVAPSNYSGPFLGSAGMTAAIVGMIIAAILDPGAVALVAILAAIGYCKWWLFGRLVCLGGNRCIIGLAMGVYDQANQVGFLGKFDTDFSIDILLAPSLLTDSIQDVAAKNTVQGHMIQDQRFCNNPVNPLQGDMVTMYNSFSNLSFTGEFEGPADIVGTAAPGDAIGRPLWIEHQAGIGLAAVDAAGETIEHRELPFDPRGLRWRQAKHRAVVGARAAHRCGAEQRAGWPVHQAALRKPAIRHVRKTI